MEVGQGPNWGCSVKEKKMYLWIIFRCSLSGERCHYAKSFSHHSLVFQGLGEKDFARILHKVEIQKENRGNWKEIHEIRRKWGELKRLHHGGKATITVLDPRVLIYLQNFLFLSFTKYTVTLCRELWTSNFKCSGEYSSVILTSIFDLL
jgi:hypothetical protein